MYLKKVFILFIILLIILSTPGCTQPSSETATQPTKTAPTERRTTGPADPSAGVAALYLSAFPAVNQTVELTFNIDFRTPEFNNLTKVWIEFERYDPALWYPLGRGQDKDRLLQRVTERFNPKDPVHVRLKELAALQPESFVLQEAVVVSGNLSWEGPPRMGDKVHLSAKVRFPETGEWLVNGWWQKDGESPGLRKHLKLTVTEDSGTFHWHPDYSTVAKQGAGNTYPIGVLIKPSRSPLVGEPFEVTLWIRSVRDVAQAEVFLNIYRRVGNLMVKGGFLEEGTLGWSGSLEKDVPVEISGKLTFLEEGDWRIQAWSRSSPEALAGHMDYIALHISKEGSWFGWPEDHHPKGLDPHAESSTILEGTGERGAITSLEALANEESIRCIQVPVRGVSN